MNKISSLNYKKVLWRCLSKLRLARSGDAEIFIKEKERIRKETRFPAGLKRVYIFLTALISLAYIANDARAADLPVPRFVTLRSEKVNARVGPGLRYPIEWVFVRHKLPVKVVREFGHWRLIRDIEGAEGWVHQRMLSGYRAVMIQNNGLTKLHARPIENSKVLAKLEAGVICQLLLVEKNWIKVKIENYKGWLARDQIWGALEE